MAKKEKMSEERKRLVQEFLKSGEFRTANDVHDALKDLFKDALQEMLTQAKYISEQESERLRLMEEHETYKKQRDKDQVVISLIPGDTVEDKKIAVERGSNQAKGLVTTSEDDK